MGRPPRDQTRLVVAVLAGLLVLCLVWAGSSLLRFEPTSLVGPEPTAPGATAVPPAGAAPAPAPTSPSPSATAPVAAAPEIAGVQAVDPQGDGKENNSTAARAIDGDPSTSWRSERYEQDDFGGLKEGLGLAVDLGDPARVASVRLTAPGTGGAVELRVGPDPLFEGSTVVAQGTFTGGTVTLTPQAPVNARYLVLWFTRLPRSPEGDNRVLVSEIDVR